MSAMLGARPAIIITDDLGSPAISREPRDPVARMIRTNADPSKVILDRPLTAELIRVWLHAIFFSNQNGSPP